MARQLEYVWLEKQQLLAPGARWWRRERLLGVVVLAGRVGQRLVSVGEQLQLSLGRLEVQLGSLLPVDWGPLVEFPWASMSWLLAWCFGVEQNSVSQIVVIVLGFVGFVLAGLARLGRQLQGLVPLVLVKVFWVVLLELLRLMVLGRCVVWLAALALRVPGFVRVLFLEQLWVRVTVCLWLVVAWHFECVDFVVWAGCFVLLVGCWEKKNEVRHPTCDFGPKRAEAWNQVPYLLLC